MPDQIKNSTLVNLLKDRAYTQPEHVAYTFLADGETVSGTLTYQQLDEQARAIAAHLQSWVPPGARALVVYPYSQGLEFIAAFFGCLYAGVVAVTCNPPRHSKSLAELEQRAMACQAQVLLTSKALLDRTKSQLIQEPEVAPQLGKLPWLATDELTVADASSWQEPLIVSNSLAYLQYTSGSTGIPKGVMISHRNVLHNSAIIQKCFEHTSDSRGLLWLPLFHDMGLVGGIIQPIQVNFPIVLMSPIALMQKPFCWLQAISRYQITSSGGPNFAYDLACYKITPEQRASLDLSSWDVAFSGAEPVRAETIERFTAIYNPCGFRPDAFYPCYGMAETTLFITGGLKTEVPKVLYVDGAALEQNQVYQVASNQAGALAIISCGRTQFEDKILIVEPEALTVCSDNRVGEIWMSGLGVGQGYWNQPEETDQTFCAYTADTGEGPFLRTGDLGFINQGELYITGRLKELMIFWGRNRYPQPIESTAEKSHPALRPNCGAAFSIEVNGEEKLIIAQEVERNYLRGLPVEEVIDAICQAVAQEHTVETYAIALLKPASIPKTSSGKVQRRVCRTQFLAKTLEIVALWQEGQTQLDSILELLNN